MKEDNIGESYFYNFFSSASRACEFHDGLEQNIVKAQDYLAVYVKGHAGKDGGAGGDAGGLEGVVWGLKLKQPASIL